MTRRFGKKPPYVPRTWPVKAFEDLLCRKIADAVAFARVEVPKYEEESGPLSGSTVRDIVYDYLRQGGESDFDEPPPKLAGETDPPMVAGETYGETDGETDPHAGRRAARPTVGGESRPVPKRRAPGS